MDWTPTRKDEPVGNTAEAIGWTGGHPSLRQDAHQACGRFDGPGCRRQSSVVPAAVYRGSTVSPAGSTIPLLMPWRGAEFGEGAFLGVLVDFAPEVEGGVFHA